MSSTSLSLTDRLQPLVAACVDPRRHTRESLCGQARSMASSWLQQQQQSSALHSVPHDSADCCPSSAPDHMLAGLLQSLAPAFHSSHAARACALATVAGALQACREQNQGISLPLHNMLGKFLLTHAGPIQQDNNGLEDDEEEEEAVRDAAMSALLEMQRVGLIHATAAGSEALLQRLSLAQSAVEQRVAQDEQDENDDMGVTDRERITVNGLSLLPRSRRSQCFDMLQASVDAMGERASAMPAPDASLHAPLVDFVHFSCYCLHGESDPRCLLQLLRLLRALQMTLAPYFLTYAGSSPRRFPIDQVFDAVAPYYPIQFHPPPNDPHGITKEMLQTALRHVMACTDYDGQAKQYGDDTMLSLSLSIILEQLAPLPGDEPTTMTEKYDALADLEYLLWGTRTDQVTSLWSDMLPATLQALSQALVTTHQEAALVVAANPSLASEPLDEKAALAKRTANRCRDMVAKMALECEAHAPAWNAFVGETVQTLSETMVSASRGRLSIAYMANLCSCGGLKTMELCLQRGLKPLLHVLNGRDPGLDADTQATAAYGVGAFFAAAKKTMERAKGIGIVVTPHPLAKYAAEAVDRLLDMTSATKEDDRNVLVVATAAVRASESLVLALSPDSLTNAQMGLVCSSLSRISLALTEREVTSMNECSEAFGDYLVGCAKLLGSLLGRMGEEDSLLSEESALGICLQHELLPRVIMSAKATCTQRVRYDWMILSVAIESGRPAATSRLIRALMERLRDCLSQKALVEAETCGQALALLHRLGGEHFDQTFHDLDSSSVAASDIFDALVGVGQGSDDSGNGMSLDHSLLALPPTEDDRKEMANVRNASCKLATTLRTAWIGAPQREVARLLSQASKSLPPLSEADLFQLSVVMPLLSAALSKKVEDAVCLDEEACKGILPDLTDFALRPENLPETRSQSAACIQLLVANHLPSADDCPAAALANDFVMPALQEAIKANDLPKILDTLSILAVLCASAALRGRESLNTADQFVKFFVDICCTGKAQLSLGGEREVTLDIDAFEEEDPELPLKIAARFASILQNDFDMRLWKQRLIHVASSRTQSINVTQVGGKTPTLGLVAMVCYIVCLSDRQVLGQSTRQLASQVALRGLSPQALSGQLTSPGIKKLLLAALLKLLASDPGTLSQSAPQFITGAIRAYSDSKGASHTADISCKLLSLQLLELLFRCYRGNEAIDRMRPAVKSLLASAMNHPSSVIRQASVALGNILSMD